MAKSLCLTAPEAGHVVFNRDVPRRISEDHLSALLAHETLIALRHQRIGAEQPMVAKAPEVAELRHWRIDLIDEGQRVLFVDRAAEDDVDLAHFKAAHAEIDIVRDLEHVAKLELQRIDVPA